MKSGKGLKPSMIDRDNMPDMFPTHLHSPQFWEQLGRTIATYGRLEETLGKAIFAFTGTRKYSPDEIDAAYTAWLPKLEKALTDQLWNLIESYGKAVRENPEATIENVDDLVDSMKKMTVWRNVLCHGSWPPPEDNGTSVPFFVNKQKEIFTTPVDIGVLEKVQSEVSQLICDVVDTVTRMGWQFPGGAGLGKPIYERGSIKL